MGEIKSDSGNHIAGLWW